MGMVMVYWECGYALLSEGGSHILDKNNHMSDNLNYAKIFDSVEEVEEFKNSHKELWDYWGLRVVKGEVEVTREFKYREEVEI